MEKRPLSPPPKMISRASPTLVPSTSFSGRASLGTLVTAFDAATNDEFSFRVDIQGDILMAGTRYEDDNSATKSGSVYVYTRTNGVWNYHLKLTASDALAYDYFGNSVAINSDTALGSKINFDSEL